ncbi:MAG: SDR family NAD(P)-dependent oxidoreductase [Thermoanaerobaculia bacterium]
MVNESIEREKQSPFDLSGRAAIVTGASRRIGASIARILARAGAKVAVHYRSGRDRALKVAESITELGGVA